MNGRSANTGPFRVGDVILDKFEVKGLLGKGGYAFVYHCHNTFLAQEVAIKMIPQMPHRGPQLLQRARAEAQVLSRLDHPNLVRVMDGGEINGMAYIVMEKLDGLNLREFLTKLGPLTVVESLSIALQVAEALEAAHALKVIHRDLKPDNIFLLADNHVKVLDFGIAKFTEGYQTTQRDLIQGTAPYMSPEQAQGHGVTPASDIFQLGIVMYEMIAGICPCMIGVEEPTPQVLIAIQVAKLPPRLKSLVPSVPDYVDRLIWRAIAKHPHQRFPVMSEFTDAIRGALGRLQEELPSCELMIRTVVSPPSSGPRAGGGAAAAPKTTPIALVTAKAALHGSPLDTDRMPGGGAPASAQPSWGAADGRRSAPPTTPRNTPSPSMPVARRTPNGRAIAAALANRPALPSNPRDALREPVLAVGHAPPAAPIRSSRSARRMLTNAVLLGCAFAVPAGLGIALLRRAPAPPQASAQTAPPPAPSPPLEPVLQPSALPAVPAPPSPPPETVASAPVVTVASSAPRPSDTLAPMASRPIAEHSAAPATTVARASSPPAALVSSGLDAAAVRRPAAPPVKVPKPAAIKPAAPAPAAAAASAAPHPPKLIF